MPHQNLFDQAARDYEQIHDRSLPMGIHSSDFIAQRSVHAAGWINEMDNGRPLAFLDFGCGNGRMLGTLAAAPALDRLRTADRLRLFGLDTSRESIAAAKTRLPAGVKLAGAWPELPAAVRFDLITACHVFHHIPLSQRASTAASLRARMNPQSRLVIWEHNPANPMTRLLVRACPFDRGAHLLSLHATRRLFEASGFRQVGSAYIHIFPPQWRRAGAFEAIERRLSRLPLGAQYWAMFAKI